MIMATSSYEPCRDAGFIAVRKANSVPETAISSQKTEDTEIFVSCNSLPHRMTQLPYDDEIPAKAEGGDISFKIRDLPSAEFTEQNTDTQFRLPI